MIRSVIIIEIFILLSIFLSNRRYFEEEEEPESSSLEYIPAPGSPTAKPSSANQDSDDEEDPLDAYMSGIEKQVSFLSSVCINITHETNSTNELK